MKVDPSALYLGAVVRGREPGTMGEAGAGVDFDAQLRHDHCGPLGCAEPGAERYPRWFLPGFRRFCGSAAAINSQAMRGEITQCEPPRSACRDVDMAAGVKHG